MTTTDRSTGSATANLVPSETGYRTYSLLIEPDGASDFQPTSTTVNVGAAAGYAQPIQLLLRPQLTGRVVGPDSKPLRGVMVVPTPARLQPTSDVASVAVAYANTASPPPKVTDSDGRFAIRLDKLPWQVALVPPAETMLPRVWTNDVDVASDVDVGDEQIPRGVMVKATLLDASNDAVVGADVRLYTVVPGNAACTAGDATCLAPARLRAESSTGEGGAVTFILSNKIDQ
jgi:hypothetical protein